VKPKLQTNTGMNVFELMFFVALAGVTFGVAWAVGRRFGVGWGLLAVPVTLAIAFASYSLFYWVVGFLPYPLGVPRHKNPRPPARSSGARHVPNGNPHSSPLP
jgi:hypothetical protein